MTSVLLSPVQKMKYNITWIENYRTKTAAIRQDLVLQTKNVLARMELIDLDDEGWSSLWESFKPKRQINHMLDSIFFFECADRFLRSKKTEIELLLKYQLDPETFDPEELAQHNVRHQLCLDNLEKAGSSDCEEMLADIQQGTLMVQMDEGFEVLRITIVSILIDIFFQLQMGRDITRTYRPNAREWETDVGPVRRRKKLAKTPFDRKSDSADASKNLGCTKTTMKKSKKKPTKSQITMAQMQCIASASADSKMPRLEPVKIV